jgi:uridine kinase
LGEGILRASLLIALHYLFCIVKPIFTIGITGGSASGKTHFLNKLSSYFKEDEVCLISQDHYYKPIHLQHRDENGIENFDLPESIDREAFHADVLKLKAGEVLRKKEYTFNKPKSEAKDLIFKPAPILIVEGLFVQHFEEISALLDLKIFMEAKTHLTVARRIRRDAMERGYDMNDVLYRFEHHVMPIYESVIEPLKYRADFIIPNNGQIDASVRVVAGFLKTLL